MMNKQMAKEQLATWRSVYGEEGESETPGDQFHPIQRKGPTTNSSYLEKKKKKHN